MARAGRRRSAVWACFVENGESRKRRVICRFCQHDIVANPARMVRHIIKHCPNADEQHKQICSEYQALTVPLRRRPSEHPNETSDPSVARMTTSPPLSFGPAQSSEHSPQEASLLAESEAPERAAGASFDVAAIVQAESESSSLSAERCTVDLVHEELALAIASSLDVVGVVTHPRFQRVLNMLNVAPLSVRQVRDRLIPRIQAQIYEDTSTMLRAATAITIQITAMSLQGGSRFEFFASDQDHRQVPLPILAPQTDDINVCVHELAQRLPCEPQSQIYLCTDAFGEVSRAGICENPVPPELPMPCCTPRLVSRCMMQISLSLFGQVVKALPVVRQACVSSETVCQHISAKHNSPISSHMSSDDPFDQWSLQFSGFWKLAEAVNLVKRHKAMLLASPCDNIRRVVQEQAFWVGVELASDIIQPFMLLSTLSEAAQLNSSIFVVCWLLVWAIVQHSSGATEAEKSSVGASVVEHLRVNGELGLVCLVVDPRCRGLGLTALGKRKTKSLVGGAALKLNSRLDSSRLVEHLVKYLNGESPFDDEESLQMMASLPRVFWVEYMAEAHELASLALASLSIRPFIYSLRQTWQLSKLSGGPKYVPNSPGFLDHTLRRLGAQAEVVDNQTIERRKKLIETAFRDGLSTSASSLSVLGACLRDAESQVAEAGIDESNEDSLIDQFITAAEFVSPSGMAEVNSPVDASWFAVEDTSTLRQLHDCLHHALFGEVAANKSAGCIKVSDAQPHQGASTAEEEFS